ncbi:MAG: hypothetical protein Q9180_006902 [Flavoplaca navasiana]
MASPMPPEAKHGRPSQNASAQPSRMRTHDNDSPSNGSQGKELVDADSGIDRVPAGTRALRKGKRKEEEVVHRDLGSSKEALPTKALTKPRGKTSSSDQPKTSPSIDQDCLSLRSRQSFVSSGCHSSHEQRNFTLWLRGVETESPEPERLESIGSPSLNDGKALRKEYKKKLLKECVRWPEPLDIEEIKELICFDDDDQPNALNLPSAEKLNVERDRYEYHV